MTALLDVGAEIGWPDTEAAQAARQQRDPRHGRLDDLVEWLAATHGRFPPAPLRRPRCVSFGPATTASAAAAELAATVDVGVRAIELSADPGAAFTDGAAAADAEIEAGADLLILAAGDEEDAATTLISLLTGAEPIALLPRGADAIDADAWIARATHLRDARRTLVPLRTRPDELLATLGSQQIAAALGFALQAAVRRTPLILDGLAAIGAGLLGHDIQSRARLWWQIADTASGRRAFPHALDQLEMTPVLDIGSSVGDGVAGFLAVSVIRAAIAVGAADE